jgi:hypothetical protein
MNITFKKLNNEYLVTIFVGKTKIWANIIKTITDSSWLNVVKDLQIY